MSQPLRINEVFHSIQGEGVNQGLPTVFVRLQGCNLRCSYCDTRYAQEETGGKEMSIEEVLARIAELSPSSKTRICITGGEPLLQEEVVGGLVAKLNRNLFYIECFTNGSFPRPFWWTRVNSWIVDIKTPSSGVFSTNAGDWLDSRLMDQIKLTVGDESDLEFAEGIMARLAILQPQVIVSPVITTDVSNPIEREWLAKVVDFCKARYKARFSLQWHKVIWGNRKGV